MKLLLETLMIFFATLLAAALVAFGEPANAEVELVGTVVPEAARVAQVRVPAN